MVSTVLLLLCETSCPPQQQEQGLPAAVPGLATTDAKLHCCCCWCCSPVLLLLWFGHTHAHKNCASDLWVEGIQTTTSRDTPAGCAANRPSHLPSRSDRAQTLRNTTSYILLQRGFTATPARCWADLYGVGCLSVRAAKAVSLCILARHLSACLFHVSARGAIMAAASANSRRLSHQNPHKACVSLVELGQTSRHFLVHFEKIPTKKFPRYGRCAIFLLSFNHPSVVLTADVFQYIFL